MALTSTHFARLVPDTTTGSISGVGFELFRRSNLVAHLLGLSLSLTGLGVAMYYGIAHNRSQMVLL